ncbi:hypothetical protein PYW08_003432 [Mythimna loreyi]|uniref:Uncharacterized protein n=1 Tax=Mythimna loreyi TaxID=667449 RepID=A0ACC2QVD0_9NEOP|nr:hypothetical protein PYW08_003432 [Mythimna loreyi]
MRRTYRSKKDTGGVIDRRDLLQNLDVKSSAYDAFFIQNIKQTKRELSCVGSSNAHGVASNRVRKRKNVKRIVKEVETPCRESLSQSAYLTPDKSIRVNKPMDPFDMLLNSSNACTVEVLPRKNDSVTSKVDLFDKLVQKKQGKTYTRRKPVKKINHFDSDSSDSDKENSDEKVNITRNTSDIKAYQLLIENEANATPKRINDSINNIVNNLSLLNKLKHKSSFNDSMKKPLSYYKHRLTRNIQSPILQKSPLCSTPFKAKYRGESIFKFSPITISNEDKSPKYTTITEDNDNSNDSIVFLGNNKTKSHKDSKENTQNSVGVITNTSIKCDIDNEILLHESETNNEEVFQKDSPKEKKTIEISKSNTTSSVEISSFQTTEVEPFLGFSNEANKELKEDKSFDKISDLDEIEHGNDVTEIEVLENSRQIDEDCQSNFSNETKNVKEDNNDTSLESENYDKDSLYDTCNSDQSSIEEKEVIKEPIVKIQRMNDSLFLRYYKNMKDFGSDGEETQGILTNESTECNGSQHDESIDGNKISLKSREIDIIKASKGEENYMSQEEEFDDENSRNEVSNESIVTQGDETNASQESGDLSQGEEFASFENSNASTEQTSENDSCTDENVDNYLLNNEANNYVDIVSSNDDDGEFKEDEKCISFVTTRRRNEVTNNSMMSIFNDSYASSSTDCDKTVLSNNRETKSETNKENLNEDETLMNLNDDKQLNSDNEVLELRKGHEKTVLPNCEINQDTRISFVTTRISNITDRKSLRNRKSSMKPRQNSVAYRKSPILARESMRHSPEASRKTCFEKPVIVLQPGKKWERSLSIFRRMTMMTDHFDQSILEEEPNEKKGRKYRQSVIETMEMQELNGSLHNESINSRRSTFVSKPCRSTIRIVKDPDISRLSLCNTSVFDDLKGK